MYWETFRQEARNRLRDLGNLSAIQDPEALNELAKELEQKAHPPDPEADGHFSRESVRIVKGILGGSKLKADIGKKTVKKHGRHA